jgi:hypothetical protein
VNVVAIFFETANTCKFFDTCAVAFIESFTDNVTLSIPDIGNVYCIESFVDTIVPLIVQIYEYGGEPLDVVDVKLTI